MTDEEKIAFKIKLKNYALGLLNERLSEAGKMAAQAGETAAGEEKSSAGDKYETSRAMSHLENEMYGKQMQQWIKELAALQAISIHHNITGIQLGSIVETRAHVFFIAAGLGRQIVDGKEIFFLAPNAPLAKTFYGLKKADSLIFKNIQEEIITFY